MLKNISLILASIVGILAGPAFLYAQETPPTPRDHMMMQDMANMRAQMSKMMENCNKMMEGMMQHSAPAEKK